MRSLSLVFGFLVLLGTIAQADEGIPTPVVQAIKAATVFVKVKVESGSSSGSGFVVKTDGADAYIVTNHHVIEPKLVKMLLVPGMSPGVRSPAPRHSIGPRPTPYVVPPSYTPRFIVHSFKNAAVTVVLYSGTKNEQAISAQVLAADPERDLAILKVSGATTLPKPIDYLHEPELTETMPICIFGYPYGEVLATSKSSPAITIGKGSISSLRLDDSGELALVQIDGSLNPGNSGGPVVDAQGRLVGVAVATIKNSSGIGLAIPARQLSQMLAGRLGRVYLHDSRDDDGVVTIHVEAGLIDPFHKIKSVTLRYLDAGRVSGKPKPSEPLDALPGCRTLPLNIENQLAVGKIRLEKSVTQAIIWHQTVCVDGSGKQAVTDSVVETVKPKAEEVAKATDDSPPSTAARESQKSDSPTTEKDLSGLVADLKSGEMDRRIRATLQLDRIKPQKPHPDVAGALEMVLLEDGHAFLRSHAARLLKTWGTPESIPALKKASRDPEPNVRDCVKEAIEDISAAAEHRDGNSSARNGSKRSAPSGQAKERAGGQRRPMDDLDLLLTDLKSSNMGRRMHALLKLKNTKPQEPHPEVAKALETVLLEDGNANMRVLAANGLKTWGTSENIPTLKKALKDPESSVRHWAKQAIEGINLAAEDADRDSSEATR